MIIIWRYWVWRHSFCRAIIVFSFQRLVKSLAGACKCYNSIGRNCLAPIHCSWARHRRTLHQLWIFSATKVALKCYKLDKSYVALNLLKYEIKYKNSYVHHLSDLTYHSRCQRVLIPPKRKWNFYDTFCCCFFCHLELKSENRVCYKVCYLTHELCINQYVLQVSRKFKRDLRWYESG